MVDVHDALFGDPFHTGIQTGYAEQVDSAGFETVGVLFQMAGDGRTHTGTAEACLTDFDAFAHVGTADAGGSHQAFVAGKTVNVNVLCLHVKVNSTCALTAVHHEDDAVFVADASEVGQRLDGADDVGAVGADRELGVGTDGLAEIVGIHIAAFVKRKVSHGDEATLFHHVQRTEHGVVFQHGGDDVCAGVGVGQSLKDDVQGVGGVITESQTVEVAAAVEQLGEHFAGVRNKFASLDGGVKTRASRIDPMGAVKMVHKVVNLGRFRVRSCGIV